MIVFALLLLVPAAAKPFAYLVQVPDDTEALSDFGGEDSDVFVLYWKTKPLHLKQNELFVPKSSWNSGRNALLEAAKRSGNNYLYYIFSDHDVVIEEVQDFGKNTGNSFRTFERYLLDYEPAVGLASYQGQDYDSSKEAQVVYGFDGVFNAYHREVADFLLPYSTDFDDESWWYSMFAVMTLSAAYFNEHRLQFNAVRVVPGRSIGHFGYPHEIDYDRPFEWLLPAITDKSALRELRYDTHDPDIAKALRGTAQKKRGSYEIDSSRYQFCHPYFHRLNKRFTSNTTLAISSPCNDARIETSVAQKGVEVGVEVPMDLSPSATVEVSVSSVEDWHAQILRETENGVLRLSLPPLHPGEHVVRVVLRDGTQRREETKIKIEIANYFPELHPHPKAWFASPRKSHLPLVRTPSGKLLVTIVVSNFNMPEQGVCRVLINEVLAGTFTQRETILDLTKESPGDYMLALELVDTEGNVVHDESVIYFSIAPSAHSEL